MTDSIKFENAAQTFIPAIDDIGIIGYTPHGGLVKVTQMCDYDNGNYYRIAYFAQEDMPETNSEVFETLEETHAAMSKMSITGKWMSLEEIDD
jgi:hypothetical protein